MSPCPGDSQQGVCFWSPIYVMMFVAIAAVQGSGCSYRYETFVKLWQWLEIEQSSQKIWNRSSPAADRPGPEPVTGLVRTVAMSLALYTKLLLQTALHTNYQFGSVRQHHRFQLLWTDPMTPSLSTRITDRDHAGHSGNQLWLCLLLGLGYEAVISCTHIGIMLLTSWSGSTLQWGTEPLGLLSIDRLELAYWRPPRSDVAQWQFLVTLKVCVLRVLNVFIALETSTRRIFSVHRGWLLVGPPPLFSVHRSVT